MHFKTNIAISSQGLRSCVKSLKQMQQSFTCQIIFAKRQAKIWQLLKSCQIWRTHKTLFRSFFINPQMWEFWHDPYLREKPLRKTSAPKNDLPPPPPYQFPPPYYNNAATPWAPRSRLFGENPTAPPPATIYGSWCFRTKVFQAKFLNPNVLHGQ